MSTRREFLGRGAAAAAALAASPLGAQEKSAASSFATIAPSRKPVIVTRICGDNSIAEAYAMMVQGADTLEAALHVCQGREDDPNDHTVGLGGLPNEEGVVAR
jgi:N4-(beta-N-acetylglucosaminyl)-L-asparaginase